MKMFRLLVVAVCFFIIGTGFAPVGSENGENAWTSQIQTVLSKADSDNPDKYAGYAMDGVTSASKLAAQRSHTVSGKDERNFAVFTGITVILIIFFFTQFKFFDK